MLFLTFCSLILYVEEFLAEYDNRNYSLTAKENYSITIQHYITFIHINVPWPFLHVSIYLCAYVSGSEDGWGGRWNKWRKLGAWSERQVLNSCTCFSSLNKKIRNISIIYQWLWRRAFSILLSDLPRLAMAGRFYQQTRQLYVLYMLRDKIRRRGFSDKTVKDYLSFGGPWWFAIKTDFEEKREWQERRDDGKGWRTGREGVEAGVEGGLKMAEGGGSCHAGRILFSV